MKEIEIARGGTATILEMDGERVVLLSRAPYPPGSPLEAKLEGETLRIKVRGSRRVEPDEAGRAYRIEGRFVSLSRALRGRLGG